MSDHRHQSGATTCVANPSSAAFALLCILFGAPALSQDSSDSAQDYKVSAEDYQRYEAERLRQQQLRFEAERQRQDAVRREQEHLRLENERREQEQLRFEANERERQQALLARQQQDEASSQVAANAGPDIYEQLRTIGQLRDDGILTEQEFADLKKKILQ